MQKQRGKCSHAPINNFDSLENKKLLRQKEVSQKYKREPEGKTTRRRAQGRGRTNQEHNVQGVRTDLQVGFWKAHRTVSRHGEFGNCSIRSKFDV